MEQLIDSSDNLATEAREFVICKLRSASVIRLPVEINDRKISAILDTAAEVSILSDQLFQNLHSKPKIVKKVIMNAAGRDMRMTGAKLDSVRLKIGSHEYLEPLYVAPIEDDMLLGLDFLLKYQAKVDLNSQVLHLGGETIPLTLGETDPVRVFKITTSKKLVVPPFSVLRVPCKLDNMGSDYLVEPTSDTLLSPRTLQKAGSQPVLSFVNCGDRNVKILKGQLVGLAYEIDEVVDELATQETFQISQANVISDTDKCETNEVPDHLMDLYNRSIEFLDQGQQNALKDMLCSYADVFAQSEFDLGNFTALEHSIDTGNARPIKHRMRRTPQCFVEEEEKHLNKMLDAGIIEPSVSEWISAPVLIRKKDKSLRWCVDYRALNAVTTKDVFPLPMIDECIDSLIGNTWFSKLDANSAYFQIKVNENDKRKTAFITKYGTFQFIKMPFGLCNAPSTFSRVMNLVLRGLNWKTVLAFLDDILVLGNTFRSHIENLRQVLERFRSYGLKLKPKKCELFQIEVEFLGRKVSKKGIEVGPGYVETIIDWPIPKCTKDVEKFCGFANYHRNFIQDFAELATPLYSVTGKNKFHWDEEQQQAFDNIKSALTSAPVLALPTKNDQFVLDTDASDQAVGAVLSQVQNGQERVIAFASVALTPEQKRYCTTRKEL